MKKVFVVIGIFIITMAQSGYTDDTSRHALAEELLVLMDTQKNIEKSFEMVKQMQFSQLQEMVPQTEGSSKQAQSVIKETMDIVSQEMSWDKIKDDYIRIYADTFTEEELKGIVRFYKTPIGQKFIEKTPELMRKSMEISQKQMRELMPKIQKMIKEMKEKCKK